MRHIVEIAEIKVARTPDILVSIGLGSCVAVILYDRITRIGGMTHALLPGANGFISHSRKFVDSSTMELLRLMVGAGAQREGIVGKLVGGATLFDELTNTESIGERNISAGKEILRTLGIEIAGEDVGGRKGRSVEFHLTNGDVIVKIGNRIKCII